MRIEQVIMTSTTFLRAAAVLSGKLTRVAKALSPPRRSCSDGRRRPRLMRRRSEDAEGGSGHEMLLDVEIIIDGSVGGEEPLSRSLRLELLLFSFSSSDGQVRVLGPVVCAHAARAMAFGQIHLPHRGAVRCQAVGGDRLIPTCGEADSRRGFPN